MKHIGNRLRELRLKNDMSQEYVAKMLGVSVQAVSKWETGKSDPEIGSLLPLADLFHVPVDELLDREKRRQDWEKRIANVLAGDDRNAKLQFLKDAVLEFPGDHKFRYALACEEYRQAWVETEPQKQQQMLMLAEEHFASLRREFPEFTNAIDMYVLVLTALDRRDEAVEKAKASPNRERLLLSVLEGDNLAVQKRKVAAMSLLTLLTDLTREGTPEALKMVETIITDAAGQDGRLLDLLLGAYYSQALISCERGQTEEAVTLLEKGYRALKCYEEQEGGSEQILFLDPIIPRGVKKEYAPLLLAFLRDERFACLRERPDFQTIQTDVEQMAEENAP